MYTANYANSYQFISDLTTRQIEVIEEAPACHYDVLKADSEVIAQQNLKKHKQLNKKMINKK